MSVSKSPIAYEHRCADNAKKWLDGMHSVKLGPPEGPPFGTEVDIPPKSKLTTSKFAKYSKVIHVNTETVVACREPMEMDPRKHFASATMNDFKKYKLPENVSAVNDSHRLDVQRNYMAELAQPKLSPPAISRSNSSRSTKMVRTRPSNSQQLDALRDFVNDKLTNKNTKAGWH